MFLMNDPGNIAGNLDEDFACAAPRKKRGRLQVVNAMAVPRDFAVCEHSMGQRRLARLSGNGVNSLDEYVTLSP